MALSSEEGPIHNPETNSPASILEGKTGLKFSEEGQLTISNENNPDSEIQIKKDSDGDIIEISLNWSDQNEKEKYILYKKKSSSNTNQGQEGQSPETLGTDTPTEPKEKGDIELNKLQTHFYTYTPKERSAIYEAVLTQIQTQIEENKDFDLSHISPYTIAFLAIANEDLERMHKQQDSETQDSPYPNLQQKLNEILGKLATAQDKDRNRDDTHQLRFEGLNAQIPQEGVTAEHILHKLIAEYESPDEQAEELSKEIESDDKDKGIQEVLKYLGLTNQVKVEIDEQNPEEYLISLTEGQINELLDANLLKNTLEQLKTEKSKFSLRVIPIKDTQNELEEQQGPSYVLAIDYQMDSGTIRFELELKQSKDGKQSFKLRSGYKKNKNGEQVKLSQEDISSIIELDSDEKFILLDAIAELAIDEYTSDKNSNEQGKEGRESDQRKSNPSLYYDLFTKTGILDNSSLKKVDKNKYPYLAMILNNLQNTEAETATEKSETGAEPEKTQQEEFLKSIFSYPQQEEQQEEGENEETTVYLFEDLNDVFPKDGTINLEALKSKITEIKKDKPDIWQAWANSHPSLAYYLTQNETEIEKIILTEGEANNPTITLSFTIGDETYQITYNNGGRVSRVSKIVEGTSKQEEIIEISDASTLLYSAILDKYPANISSIRLPLEPKPTYALTIAQILQFHAEELLSLSAEQDIFGHKKKYTISLIQRILDFNSEDLTNKQKQQLQQAKDILENLLQEAEAGEKQEKTQPSDRQLTDPNETELNSPTEKIPNPFHQERLSDEDLQEYRSIITALEYIPPEDALEVANEVLLTVANNTSTQKHLSNLVARLNNDLRKSLLQQIPSQGTIPQRRLYVLLRTKGNPSKLTEIERALFWEETESTKPEIPQTLEALILLFNEGEQDNEANINIKASQLTTEQRNILESLGFKETEGSLRPSATTADSIRTSYLPDDVKRALLGHRRIPRRRDQLGTKLRQQPGNYDKELLATLLIKYSNLSPEYQISANIRKLIWEDSNLQGLLRETSQASFEASHTNEITTIYATTKKGKTIPIIQYVGELNPITILRTFSQSEKFRKTVDLANSLNIETSKQLTEEPIISAEDLKSLFDAQTEQDRNTIKRQIQYKIFRHVIETRSSVDVAEQSFYQELIRLVQNQEVTLDKERSQILSQIAEEISQKSQALERNLNNIDQALNDNNINEVLRDQFEIYRKLFALQTLLEPGDEDIDEISAIFNLNDQEKRRLQELIEEEAYSIFRLETLEKEDLDTANLLETGQYSYAELILASKLANGQRIENDVVNMNIVKLFLKLAQNRAQELKRKGERPSELLNHPLLNFEQAQEIAIDLIKSTYTFWIENTSDIENLVILHLEGTRRPISTFAKEEIEQISRIVKILSIQQEKPQQIDLKNLLQIYSNPQGYYTEELQELARQTIYHEIKRQARMQINDKTKEKFIQKYPTLFPSNESIKEELWLKSLQYQAILQGTFDPIQERILILKQIDKFKEKFQYNIDIAQHIFENLKELARTPVTIHFDTESPSNNIEIDFSNEENFMASYLEALQRIKNHPNPKTRQNLLRKIQPRKMAELLQEIGYEQEAKLFQAQEQIELLPFPDEAQQSASLLQLHLVLFYPGKEVPALLQKLYYEEGSTSPIFEFATEVITNLVNIYTDQREENEELIQIEDNLINTIKQTLNPSIFTSPYVQSQLIPGLKKALRLNRQVLDNINLQEPAIQTYIHSKLGILAQAVLNLRKQHADEALPLETILEESIAIAIQDSTTLKDTELEIILDLFQEQDLSNDSITSRKIIEFIKKYKQQITERLLNIQQRQQEKNKQRKKTIPRGRLNLLFRRRKEGEGKKNQETLSYSDKLFNYLQNKIKTSPNTVDLYRRSKAELELLLLSYAITDPYGFPTFQPLEDIIDTLYDKIQRIHYLQLAEEMLSKKSETNEQTEPEESDQHYEFLSELQEILTRLNIESEPNTTSLHIPNPDQNNYSPRTIKTQGILIQIPNKNNLRQQVLGKFERVTPTNRSEENSLTGLFLTYNPKKQIYQLYFIYTSKDRGSYAIEVKIPEPIAIPQPTAEPDPFTTPGHNQTSEGTPNSKNPEKAESNDDNMRLPPPDYDIF